MLEKETEGTSKQSAEDVSKKPSEDMSELPIEGEQFDEEDEKDYTPDFIKARLADPPLLANECQGEFEQIFESFEFGPNGRAKTDAEYILVWQATTVTQELMRLERMKVKILAYQNRPAAEMVFRRSHDNVVSEGDSEDIKAATRKWGRRYFADAEYRKAYAAKLEAAGYGAGAIEAEAFLRALPSLATIERLITALERRLLNHEEAGRLLCIPERIRRVRAADAHAEK